MKNKPINKGFKKSNVTDLVGKGKMDLPIGKLYSFGKSQTNEDKKAKEHYEGKEDETNVVRKGRWYDKVIPRWFDNESKF